MNKEELAKAYVNMTLNDMDLKTLLTMVEDIMLENLKSYSTKQLIKEVAEFYPQLLEKS